MKLNFFEVFLAFIKFIFRIYVWFLKLFIFIFLALIDQTGKKHFRRRVSSEVFSALNSYNFEKEVARASNLKTRNGLMVQSFGEKLIAEYLDRNGIKYYYDSRTTLAYGGKWIRPDFYLPGYDIYIEFWGLIKDEGYRQKVKVKKMRYTKAGKTLISVYPENLKSITNFLNDAFNEALDK